MRLMKEKPDASDAEIAEAVATCYAGAVADPSAIQAVANEATASAQVDTFHALCDALA